MGKETKIGWCRHTRNIFIGCTKATYVDEHGLLVVHPACVNCYAEKLSLFRGWAKWGAGMARRIKAKSTWNEPLGWARDASAAREQRTVFLLSLGDILDEEMDRQPAMADAFQREMEMIRATHLVCARCGAGKFQRAELSRKQLACRLAGRHDFAGGLTYLLLTKRPQRWALIPEDVRPLVWLGTSAADQPTWDRWTAELMKAQGFLGRFVSLEPQVGPVNFGFASAKARGLPMPDRVIIGGESGSKVRPFKTRWAESGIEQCAQARVSCYVKQLGAKPVMPYYEWLRLAEALQWDETACTLLGWDVSTDGQPPLDAEVVVHAFEGAATDDGEWLPGLRVRDPWPWLRKVS